MRKRTARRELVEGLGMRPDVQQMIDDLKEHRPDLF
jgi:hypothetical protein